MRMPICPHPYDLQSYLDGALPGDDVARVRRHLEDCEDCAARVAELQGLRRLLKKRQVETPAGLRDRILAFLASAVPVRSVSCREAVRMASAYIDDELDQWEREALEAHLFACDRCYVEYVAMRTAAHAMREAPRAVAHEDLKDRILSAVAAEAAQPEGVIGHIGPTVPAWRRALAPAAAVAAVALLTFGIFQAAGPRSSDVHHAPPAVVTSTLAQTPDASPAPEVAKPLDEATESVEVASIAPADPAFVDSAATHEAPEEPRRIADAALPETTTWRADAPPSEPDRAATSRMSAPDPPTSPAPSRIALSDSSSTRALPTVVVEPPAAATGGSSSVRSHGRLATADPTRRTIRETTRSRATGAAMPPPPPPPVTRVAGIDPAHGEGTRVVSAPPLTRPEPRIERAPEAVAEAPALEESDATRLVSHGWVPMATGGGTPLYVSDRDTGEALAGRASSLRGRDPLSPASDTIELWSSDD